MRYRELGRTGLEVSEIGFGAEWMEKKSAAEVRAVVERCEEAGINILNGCNMMQVVFGKKKRATPKDRPKGTRLSICHWEGANVLEVWTPFPTPFEQSVMSYVYNAYILTCEHMLRTLVNDADFRF